MTEADRKRIGKFRVTIGEKKWKMFTNLPIYVEAAPVIQDFLWRFICMYPYDPLSTRVFITLCFEEDGREDADQMVDLFRQARDDTFTHAGFIVVTKKHEILHLRRDGSKDWELPAGPIDAEEEHLDAARRWLQRLTGLKLRGSKPICEIKRGNVKYFVSCILEQKVFKASNKGDDVVD